MDECLWVRDVEIKRDHGTAGNLDPETFRCRPSGKVFCTPCGERFFGKDWGK